jgi:ATP-dependent DNA ligase
MICRSNPIASTRPCAVRSKRHGWHAFDLIELDGEDLRHAPIEERKGLLAKLLRHPHEGIAFNEHHTDDGAIRL